MDYLDPKKKRAHLIRLYIGYFLTAIAIGLSTLILVYLGSGYYFDAESGQLIQNGQFYINANPEQANITLNGELQKSKTDARLVVPGGVYSIELTRDGYRPWRRTVELEGGKIRQLAYPRLVPNELKPRAVQTFGRTPDLITQSLNLEFIMLRFADRPLTFLLVNTNESSNTPIELNLPASVLLDPAAIGSFEAVEWSANNRYVLLKHSVAGRLEYIVFDRENPAASRNATRQLALPANAVVTLRDRSELRLTVFDPAAGTVRYGDLSQSLLSDPVLSGVIDVKGFENDKLLFITSLPENTEKVAVRLLEGDQTYTIREVKKSSRYLLDMAKFGKSLVLAVGSPADGSVAVYRNPTAYLRSNPERKFALATTVLRVNNPEFLSFSTDASVVAVYGGTQFSTHEFEADRTYSFNVGTPFDSKAKLRWMDSSRLNYVSGGSVYSVDFDGSNIEKLVSGKSEFGVYYDRTYETLFSFTANAENTLFQITNTSLIAG